MGTTLQRGQWFNRWPFFFVQLQKNAALQQVTGIPRFALPLWEKSMVNNGLNFACGNCLSKSESRLFISVF